MVGFGSDFSLDTSGADGGGGGGFNIGDMIMLGDDLVTHWYLMTHPSNPMANQPTITLGTPGTGQSSATISPLILLVLGVVAVAFLLRK